MIDFRKIGLIPVFYLFGVDMTNADNEKGHASWVANMPKSGLFHNKSAHLGELLDVRNDSSAIHVFEELIKKQLPPIDGFTDGEVVDAIEHFFWGQRNGLAMELGALDGSAGTKSQTHSYESELGWNRILVEGDPGYRADLIRNSPKALGVNAAICQTETKVHFSNQAFTGGILDFMDKEFLRAHHKDVYKAGNPKGDTNTIDWESYMRSHRSVQLVDCIPLHLVLHKATARHVNFFILDVEGAELEVLKSINWQMVKFDVICVETDPPVRPPGYAAQVTAYLRERGYNNYTQQVGRNIWFTHPSFTPIRRPGLRADCFNGWGKSDREDRWWGDRSVPPFQPCPLE